MTRNDGARLSPPVGERDHVQGPLAAPVVLVEYGDFECPYCRAALPIVAAVRQRLGDQLGFVFRHFPLAESHPNAQRAAEAAEAAAAQGKFWEMHAALFAHQQALDDAHLAQYAAEVGLDAGRVARELATHAHAGRVREDLLSGLQSGARGTPTFFLDGERYGGQVGLRQLLAAIRRRHPGIAGIDGGVDSPDAPAAQRRIPRLHRPRPPQPRGR